MNDKFNFTPHSIMWTFGACLGIYLIAYGGVTLAGAALQYMGRVLSRFTMDNVAGVIGLLPSAVKLVIGLLVFQRSKRELAG